MLVHHSQLGAGGAHVKTPHRRVLFEQHDWEWVVYEDLQNLK